MVFYSVLISSQPDFSNLDNLLEQNSWFEISNIIENRLQRYGGVKNRLQSYGGYKTDCKDMGVIKQAAKVWGL